MPSFGKDEGPHFVSKMVSSVALKPWKSFSNLTSHSSELAFIGVERTIGAMCRENPPKETVSIRAPLFLGSNPQLLLPHGAALSGYANPGRYRGQGGVRSDLYGRLGGNSGPVSGYNGSDRPVPKVSTEIRILSALMGGVIGRGGANISQIRSISGASVKV